MIDSVPAYRSGLVGALLQAGYQAPSSDNEQQTCADQDGPHALLIILRTDQDWQQLTRLGRHGSPHLVLVALPMALTPATHQAALERGASAAVAFDAPLETVLAVLHAALAGRVLMPLAIAVGLGHPTVDPVPDEFSSQELRWLRMLASGATTTALAANEQHSDRTMYRRLTDLYVHLGVHNRTEAITKAARCGLLSGSAMDRVTPLSGAIPRRRRS